MIKIFFVGLALSVALLAFIGWLFLDFVNASPFDRALTVITILLAFIFNELRVTRRGIESIEKTAKELVMKAGR